MSMTTTTPTRPMPTATSAAARPRITARNDALACLHQAVGVCDACFDATPGLIDVWGTTYRYEGEPFTTYAQIHLGPAADRGVAAVVSLGTQEGRDYDR